MDFEERKTLFNIRKTVIEMLQDRNYIVPQSELINFDDFSIKFKNKNLDIYIDNSENDKGKVYVYFHNENKTIPKVELKNLLSKTIETYNDENIKLIILLKEKGNGSILKEINKEIYKNVEIFMNKNMIFNITHHEFVPKHIILSEEEEKEVLDKYSTPINKLPKILKTDPVAKYYGMKPNQICKIIRNSPEVGDYLYYRLVK
jgi:DNA-directed RNA polymerases I, II, and III subunit RPABC1